MEYFIRPSWCNAVPGQYAHVQLWCPQAATQVYGGVTYKRVVKLHKADVGRSTGYHIIKAGGDPNGFLSTNPYTGDGDENRGITVLDDEPNTIPPVVTWPYSQARVYAGSYSVPKSGGQYCYFDGVGMNYNPTFETPIEFGPSSGIIVRNINPNQGIIATFYWSEAWVAL